MKKSEILNSTLEAFNKNNAIKISFSNRERIIIKNMMEQYAEKCVKASLEKSSKNAIPCTGTDEGGDYFAVDKESITNPENIILL